MKQKVLILFVITIIISACAAPLETSHPTKIPVPLTATPAPTETLLPSPTSTPTPDPYLLEDGVLLDWDESTGEYVTVSEGIDAITTTADEVVLALDGTGFPRFVFVEDAWVEIKIPEGAENHKQVDVADRYVTIVNEEGKTEEILESGTKVLVNPETGKYEYELKNGVWVKYVPRVMVVGENMSGLGLIEMPKGVIESAAETVQNAEMFKRVIDGEEVELKTGMDELWGKVEGIVGGKEAFLVYWYGVLCGVVEKRGFPRTPIVLMGVEMHSGDILLVNIVFNKEDWDYSSASLVIDGGIMSNGYESDHDTMEARGRSITSEQRINGIMNSPLGTPFFMRTHIDSNLSINEGEVLTDALKEREFWGSSEVASFRAGLIGASDTFWDFAESQ